ncbi:MAG TPA: response regulator [Verrucomicrobiae bacterium]
MNEPVNILLVDDEVRNLEVIESVLQSPDHRLVRAQTADEALMSLIRDEFAVIVLDIQMPVMSGLELAHLIKQRKRTQHIPIIFLTAYFQDDKDVMEGYGLGAVDYLNKPINPQILRSKVAVFVELFRKTRALQTINHALELEVAQRQKAEEALLKSNLELDNRVRSRTVELTAANDSLRASEQLYRAIGESINYGIWVCDPAGNNIYASESFLRLIGLSQRELSERGIQSVMHPEDWESGKEAWDQCCRAGTFWEREYRFKGKEGLWHPILSRGVPIRSEGGGIVRWAGIHLDIAAFKHTEKALRHQTRVLEILHRASVSLVAERDIRKIAQCVTDAGVEISEAAFGAFYHPVSMSEEKVLCTLSGPPPEIFLGLEGEDVEKIFWPTLNGVGIVRVNDLRTDVRFKKLAKGGRGKQALAVRSYLAVPVVSRNGEILGGLYFGHPEEGMFPPACEDVLLALAAQTAIAMDNANLYLALQRELEQQKRTETALLQSQDRLSGALRAKDDFLAALSHELRTPLNPVLLLASESAEDKTLPEPVRANFESIRNYVEMEARLIDDLLDLTRITRGKLSLSIHVESVHTLVRNVIHILHGELEQKKISLELKFDPGEPQVMGDAVRLQQVFWNVLKNAVKFTPDGGRIWVETRVDSVGGRVLTRVSDTGIGMTASELKRIFGAFSQGDHASEGSSHRFGGIGLGLTISQMLAELQGGKIRAESQGRGQGATIEVALPLASASATAPKELLPPVKPTVVEERPVRADGNKRRVLLVEDHEATRTALIYLLSRRGYEVVAAGSVMEALEQAKRHEIHLLISDIGLPDGTGYDVMLKLGGEGLPGIALTGYGMEEDTMRSQKAGFAMHLTKPVKVQALDQALASLKLAGK